MAVIATIPRRISPDLFSGSGLAHFSQRVPRRSTTDCALYGASLFFVCAKKSKQKKAPPDIRVSLRSTPLLPVPLRGPAYKGHPWPFKPLAASLRLVPLRNTSTRPTDGEFARMKVLRFRPGGVVGSLRRALIVSTLCVCMQPQTLHVCGTRSVPRWVPTRSVGTIKEPNATSAMPSLHHKFGPGPGPVRRLSGIVA